MNKKIDITIEGQKVPKLTQDFLNLNIYSLFSKILKCEYNDTPKYVNINYNNSQKTEKSESDNVSIIPFALRGNIDRIIEKSSDGRRIIAGYANVAIVDSEDQFIPVETLEKGITSLLEDPHYSNLMLVHQSIQIGKIIKEFKDLTTHVDDKGLFIVAEIRKDIKTADEIWESILDSEINGFSIGCEVVHSHEKCNDEKCITILDEINIFEVSVCTKPVNKESGFVVVSKSQFGDVCETCQIEIDKMSEEDKTKKEKAEDAKTEDTEDKSEETAKEETSEEKSEEEPETEAVEEKKSIEELISDINRRVNALEGILAEKQEDEEEDEEMEEEEEIVEESSTDEKETKAPTEKKQEPEEDKEPEEEEKPDEEEKPFPNKSFDEILEKLSSIADKLSKVAEDDELKLAVKARDDQIEALNLKIKKLSKDEEDKEEEKEEEPEKVEDKGKPKTLQADTENIELEQDNPIKVERGIVYYKE